MSSFNTLGQRALQRRQPPPSMGDPSQSNAWNPLQRNSNQPGWNPGFSENWLATHSFDSSGKLIGPPGSVPWSVALNAQDVHNQLVWQHRENLLANATGYAQGALRNLQSFRPGGAAAMESGVYQNLSSAFLNRASMTQPMDLLADWRREESFQARRRARKSAQLGMAFKVGGALVSAAAPFLGPVGAALGQFAGQAGQAVGEYYGSQAGQPQQAGAPAPPQTGATPGAGSPFSAIGGPQGGAGGPAGAYLGAPAGGGAAPGGAPQDQPGGPTEPGSYGARRGGGPSYMQGSGPGSLQGGQGGPAGGPGGGPEGAQGGGGAGPGAMPRVGSDGNFSPIAWAANATLQPGPLQDFTQVDVQEFASNLLEADPDWTILDGIITHEIQKREQMNLWADIYSRFRGAGYGEQASAQLSGSLR